MILDGQQSQSKDSSPSHDSRDHPRTARNYKNRIDHVVLLTNDVASCAPENGHEDRQKRLEKANILEQTGSRNSDQGHSQARHSLRYIEE